MPKTFTDDEAVYMTQSVTHHDCWTCELRSDKNSYRRVTTMQCRSHSRRRTSECLFVTACSMDEYAKDKRTENNLTVRSGISEAETTNNKRLRSTFCIEAIRTQHRAASLRQQSFLFAKLFNTNNIDTVKACQEFFSRLSYLLSNWQNVWWNLTVK